MTDHPVTDVAAVDERIPAPEEAEPTDTGAAEDEGEPVVEAWPDDEDDE